MIMGSFQTAAGYTKLVHSSNKHISPKPTSRMWHWGHHKKERQSTIYVPFFKHVD